ncbi:protein-methionine-sulfoxide reductase heme-binding subunit MsrQ [Leptothrix discophora]|uniref:Protein-methionine-sulfoxide reductase heme-binding subunit MsrQ n=1 Tax=Leptothrix discophora TaxID=89 RepID=A0ABT9G732_LEPDI|nr:protein-methionine-sulfoxide reductase heme-binding subunit MsrQ [Leptothrix discophora]
MLRPWVKPLVLLIALLPLAGWIWGIAADRLGPNPAEALLRGTGLWTLRLLIVTLAITPLRLWTKLPALARWRRMLGLTAFGYALLHFLSYAWLDMGFDAAAIVRDLDKRPFALVGFAAFVGLLPLALTSFNRAIRALGAARWQALHQLVWPVIGLGLLHFLWMRAAKHRYDEVSVYAAIVVVLIAARLAKGSTVAWFKARRRP